MIFKGKTIFLGCKRGFAFIVTVLPDQDQELPLGPMDLDLVLD